MAMKPCRQCGREINAAARFCPACGVQDPILVLSTRPAPAPPDAPSRTGINSRRVIFGLPIVGFGLLGVFVGIHDGGDSYFCAWAGAIMGVVGLWYCFSSPPGPPAVAMICPH